MSSLKSMVLRNKMRKVKKVIVMRISLLMEMRMMMRMNLRIKE